MSTIIIAIFSVTIMGIICAVILSFASKFMNVKVDERLAQLQEIMPGVNCGVCGYPGCGGYASALINENAKTNLCTPGGSEVLEKISSILGVEAVNIEQKTAVIYCNGDCNAQTKKMEYHGVQSCEAAKQLFCGESSCAFGCLGYADCQTVCPSNAICLSNGLARIIPGLCTGCGLCIKACPKKLISLEKSTLVVYIACKNTDKGAITRKKCTAGCIACQKCVRECPQQAITLENNLAKIDYTKCNSCKHCLQSCPTKCIHRTP
ncbi:MAG: RnfABCDGE type electron transport complex subunit B [Treponema sp.]|nr:RnfABCDGE type electron transport complex subunit B [Treponema sp.]